jgi:N-acetylglutamate synthase-like GNAT family acetyltransferase
MRTIMIRTANASDVDGILALIDANRDHLLHRTPEEVSQMIDSFWVADDGGDIVGCCCLEVYSPKIAELRSLAVRPDRRGHGLGARLAAAAVEEARRRSIPQVLVVTSNPGFFRRLNFGPCLDEKYALFWNAPEGGGE